MVWKLFRSLLLAALLLTVAGCGGDNNGSKKGGDTNTTVDLVVNEELLAVIETLGIEYGGSDSNESVTQSLTLPVEGVEDVTVSWSSSDTSIITADGSLLRPAEDTVVTLTVTISSGETTRTKNFNVLVKAALSDPTAAVVEDASVVHLDQNITGDLTLYTQGANGTTISWESNNTAVIDADGNVVIPEDKDITVTLTATITKDGATETKIFTVTVKALDADGDGVPDAQYQKLLALYADLQAMRQTLDAKTPLVGPQGPQGPQGEKGEVGPFGEVGTVFTQEQRDYVTGLLDGYEAHVDEMIPVVTKTKAKVKTMDGMLDRYQLIIDKLEGRRL